MAFIKLYIDDLRTCPEGWLLARTNTAAIRMLKQFSVEEVSIDHDIVDRTVKNNAEETFMPVVHYIALMPHPPKVITIHTANVGAAKEMQTVLREAGLDSVYKQGSYKFQIGQDINE